MQQTPVLLLRPRRLRGGGVQLAWSLYWPQTGRRSRERVLFADRVGDLGGQLRAAFARIWGPR